MAQVYRQNPAELELEITHGEPWSLSFTVNVNAYGYIFDAALILNTGVEVPMTANIVDVVQGVTTINVRLEDDQVTALQLGEARWRFTWTPPGGDERTILSGPVRIERRQ